MRCIKADIKVELRKFCFDFGTEMCRLQSPVRSAVEYPNKNKVLSNNKKLVLFAICDLFLMALSALLKIQKLNSLLRTSKIPVRPRFFFIFRLWNNGLFWHFNFLGFDAILKDYTVFHSCTDKYQVPEIVSSAWQLYRNHSDLLSPGHVWLLVQLVRWLRQKRQFDPDSSDFQCRQSLSSHPSGSFPNLHTYSSLWPKPLHILIVLILLV